MKRSKRRKIITNKNLEVKMFGDEIIEGFSFLRLDTIVVEKFDRLIIHQGILFAFHPRGISRQRNKFFGEKKRSKIRSININLEIKIIWRRLSRDFHF